ncbi:hypothetical protein C0Q70_13652 [Pomacea canaliculata]|uniref:Transcription factor CBF/NF-Y/archaeal histone domain-containing protein n=1 Tax=Pomacea canaliculata TaxID=400727 RepID=A0A2T7NXT3_POMCA|nr:DNA polymerase epsilon subunit 4-like [Pomacea canaliculata]PVD25985.1 hypothetical protein C0Q70_13652 [Pomacea canaliculata]
MEDIEETDLEQEKELQPNEGDDAQQTDHKLLKLPLSRIKAIIKMDPDVSITSHEAAVILAKATELFINVVSRDASIRTLQAKRKTLLKKDLETVLETRDCYAFLEGAIDT